MRGCAEFKEERKKASETRARLMKVYSAVLASLLRCPKMDMVMRGKEQLAVRWRKIAQIKCCAIGDLKDVMCLIQPTVEALSHHVARCSPCWFARDSKAMMCRSRVAVLRLLMEIDPFGCPSWMKAEVMVAGHSRHHTVVGRSLANWSQTPLPPSKRGIAETNVGRHAWYQLLD